MWASAHRDGHPAEYRWPPLFNAAKFGWRPILECHAVTLPTRESCWKLLGCPKLLNGSQPLVGQSLPYYEDMWGRYCCLTSFFRIVDTCLSCKDIARQSCAMVPRWQIFGDCWVLHFEPAACSRFQTCILNSHYGHTVCRSTVDIQSTTSKVRWGKNQEKKKKEETWWKYNVHHN